jgi:hypothetical protein
MATRKTAQQRPAPTKAPTRTTSSAAAKRTTTAAKRTTTPEKRTTTPEKRTTTAAKRTTSPRKATRTQPAENTARKTAAPGLTSSAATLAQPLPTVNSQESPTSTSTGSHLAGGGPKPGKPQEQRLQERLDGYAQELKALKRQVKANKAKLADLGKDLTKIKRNRKKAKAQRRR